MQIDNTPIIISLGGSLLIPNDINVSYITAFYRLLEREIVRNPHQLWVLVVGGGNTARVYQKAYQDITELNHNDDNYDNKDWIGIQATRLNAELLYRIMQEHCICPVIDNFDTIPDYCDQGGIVICSGWKPGFSTDFIAVKMAEHLCSNLVVNLSNIQGVYTTDPKKDKNAQFIEQLTWSEYLALFDSEWIPGLHIPFDPVAAKRAQECAMTVLIADGQATDKVLFILLKQKVIGTYIVPDSQ